jgi:hypothetical protein
MSASSRSLLVAPLLAIVFVTGGVPAAGAREVAVAQDDARGDLRSTIRSRFTVLGVTGGLVLVPRSPREGVESVELRGGTVAINGSEVTGSELRERLGRDADAVIELSYLEPDERQRLLLGDRPPADATPRAPAVLPPVPEAAPRRLPEVREPAAASPYRRRSEGRVRIGGDIRVEGDEEVDGPVVAVLGSVFVNGRVTDAVVAVGGGVTLGPDAQVRGDVTAVGGGVTRDQGSAVGGQINAVQFDWPHVTVRPVDWWPFSVHPAWGGGPWHGFRLMGTLLRLALFALLAVLVTLLLPGSVGRIRDTVRFEPWKCALAGLFAQLLFVPLLVIGIVVLVISIVGIPLLVLVPFVVLAFFLALLLGFAGAASAFAGAVVDRSSRSLPTAVSLLVVGLALIWGLTVVGRVVSLAGGPLGWIAALFLVAGFLVEYAAWTMGLGGALLTRFGRNGRGWTQPPPVPVTPPPLPTV